MLRYEVRGMEVTHKAFTSLAAVVSVDSEVRRWVRLTAPLDAMAGTIPKAKQRLPKIKGVGEIDDEVCIPTDRETPSSQSSNLILWETLSGLRVVSTFSSTVTDPPEGSCRLSSFYYTVHKGWHMSFVLLVHSCVTSLAHLALEQMRELHDGKPDLHYGRGGQR